MSFTHADFLAAIRKATSAQPPDAKCFTVPDLAESSNLPVNTLRRDCKKASKMGLLRPVRFTKINDWGQTQAVVGYQLVTGKNGKR